MARVGALGVVLFWSASMIWIIAHDVVPRWTARDVPRFRVGDWLTEDLLRSQARIEDKYGHRIGTVWSEYRRGQSRLSRSDVIWLESLALVPMQLRIHIRSEFTAEGDLDEFNLQVFGAGRRVELVCENFSGHLAFRLWVGERDQFFKVDASSLGMVGDVFRPFPTLPEIEVGQSWRIYVVNPLAALSGIGSKMIPMLATVTRTERLPTDEGSAECFVLETERARAWVDQHGIVLRQEMDLPVGGTLAIIAEPFDDRLRDRVLSQELDSGDWNL